MKKLEQIIEEGTSPFHIVQTVKRELENAGYKELLFNEEWNIKKGDKFFVIPYQSALFAYDIGEAPDKECNLRIAAAHTDFPCLKIKPSPEIMENGYYKLNVEVYGGPILNTWLDRPLSIAGRVSLRSKNVFSPEIRLVDFKRPVLTIPNLAIHMNKDINKGIELNRQKDMLPVADVIENEINQMFFSQYLAKELEVTPEEILDFELCVYQFEKGEVLGLDNTMYSSPRLDNITSVYACLYGMLQAKRNKGINIIALFDNEEVGSNSKQGAGSALFADLLERIYDSLYKSKEKYYQDMADAFIISADVAHCIHPNLPEKNDITNKVLLNKGIVIKYASSQSYASDCESGAVIMQLCEKNNIPYQKFVNRSDGTYGEALGSIFSRMLPIKCADVGVPLLAMHSARELMGNKDQASLCRLIETFFS